MDASALNLHSFLWPAGGASPLVSNRNLIENVPLSHLFYFLSKQSPDEFKVSVTSFKSSSTQDDVQFVT